MSKRTAVKSFHPPPWKNGDRKEWLSVSQIAELYARHHNTVLRWLHDGTLVEFGFSTFCDFQGRYWIRPPRPSSSPSSTSQTV